MTYDMDSIVFTQLQTGGTKTIDISLIGSTTNNYTISFPDASGTVALTSDLGSYVTLGTTQTISGAKTFSAIPVIDNGSSGMGLRFKMYASSSFGLNGYMDIAPVGTSGKVAFAFGVSSTATKLAYFSAAGLTDNTAREYALPDAGGTLALTSDLSNYVPYSGATTNVNLGTNQIFSGFAFINGNGSIGGVLGFKQYATSFQATGGYTNLWATGSDKLNFTFAQSSGSGKDFNFDVTSLTAGSTRSYTMPDASGTLALTIQTGSIRTGGYYLTGMTAGSGALYYSSSENRVTLANYNTGGHLMFEVDGGTYAMTVRSNGNVGINTVTPQGGAGANDRTLSINAGAGSAAFITGLVGDVKYSTLFTASSIVVLETNAAIPLAFNTNGTEKMRISSSGAVGIGVAPASWLTATITPLQIRNSSFAGYSQSGVHITYVGSNWYYDTGSVDRYISNGNATIFSQVNGEFSWATSASGTAGNAITFNQVMKLNANGTLQLPGNATTFSIGSIAGVQRIQYGTGGYTTEFAFLQPNDGYTAIGAGAFNTRSDYRLKEDLKEFNALSLVTNMKVYDFKWKQKDERNYGFMAHELQEVVPYVVTGTKDGMFEDQPQMQGLDYSKIVPVLVKAIQELNAEIKSLKNN
jgi:hypothetical protein